MKRIGVWLVWVGLCASIASGFQIDLPKNFRRDADRKCARESGQLWRELDRIGLEAKLHEFVENNPRFGGVEIAATADAMGWRRTAGPGIRVGVWSVSLADWELNFPSLKRIRWAEARLVVALSYDVTTRSLCEDGGGEIRLFFRLQRERAGWFRHTIRAEFESADFGEVVILVPTGGSKLEREQLPATGTGEALTPK